MKTVEQEVKEVTPEEEERQKLIQTMPLLSQCYNLLDFEAVARRIMKKTAWGYYSSAADDEIVRNLFFPYVYLEERLADEITRQCVRITLPTTVYGSALRFSSMLKRSISLPRCSAPKSTFLST